MENLIFDLNIVILIYFFFLALWYMGILLLAFPGLIKAYQQTQYGDLDHLVQRGSIPLTIIIPAYNEGKRVLNALYSILQNSYKNVHIIIVNDGSRDNTMDILISELGLYEVPVVIQNVIPASAIRHYYQSSLYENLSVVDKEHGPNNNGADSNNAGLNAASTPIVMTLDSDTVLEPNAIECILYTYLAQKNCIAVGGAIYILNENQVEHGRLLTRKLPKKFVPATQAIEYLRSFSYGRAGLNKLSGALCYPGAFTFFEAKAIKEVGGLDSKNYSYDAEAIIKLHEYIRKKQYPMQMCFSSNAISWTIVPNTWASFWEQRNRWQRGMLLSVSKHLTMLFNPRYGIVGLITFPAFVLFEVYGPVVEFSSYLLLIASVFVSFLSWHTVAWYMLLAWGYLVLLTIAAFYINLLTFNIYRRPADLLRMIWVVSLEMLGFRQFRAACCFYSTLQYFFNRLRGKNL